MWDDYSRELSTMLNSMPWEDLEHGEIVINADVMADWYVRNEQAGRRSHAMVTREPDGVISGITDMMYATYNPTIVHQGFTGVRASARGRGLGKWLKAAMALRIHELYPQAQWFSTDNAGSNAPMLAINTKMGFKQFRVGSEYQISRDRLAARLKELAGAP
jgi:GNAT superfamily N-acetyltransferase